MVLDATTTHYMGAVIELSTVTRNVGPPVYYSWTGDYPRAGKRIGTTLTTYGGSNYFLSLFDAATANRSLLLVTITKGSPNFGVKIFGKANGTAMDVSKDTLDAQAELSTPSLSNHSETDNIVVSIDEAANGYLDTVNIAWDRTTPKIEISDLRIVKLA